MCLKQKKNFSCQDTRRITEEIKRKCKQSNRETEFVYVDELFNKHKAKQLNNVSIPRSKRRAHATLKRESCGTVWHHDVNSALNIYYMTIKTLSPSKELQRTNYTVDLMRCLITAVHSLTPR